VPTPAVAALATNTASGFDGLARAVADVTTRVSPVLHTVAIERIPARMRRGAAPESVERRVVPGLRVRTDRLLVAIPVGWRVALADAAAPPRVLAADSEQQILLLAVIGGEGVTTLADSAVPPSGSYVAVAEAGLGGPSLRPVFLSRLDPLSDPRWAKAPLVVGGEPAMSAGAFVYTLDAQLIGLTIKTPAGLAILPGAALQRAIDDTAAGGGR
jgi:hypothetical protein